jgi:hypothetical protein
MRGRLPREFYNACDEKKDGLVRGQFGVIEDEIQRKERLSSRHPGKLGHSMLCPYKADLLVSGEGCVEVNGFAVGIGDG